MAETALAMRDVMSREEEPSFVIKDLRYVKESTNTTSLLQIFNGRWLVGLGVIAMSFVFGQLICIPTRLASSCKIVRARMLPTEVELVPVSRFECVSGLSLK